MSMDYNFNQSRFIKQNKQKEKEKMKRDSLKKK